jgi:hypothetical protein
MGYLPADCPMTKDISPRLAAVSLAASALGRSSRMATWAKSGPGGAVGGIPARPVTIRCPHRRRHRSWLARIPAGVGSLPSSRGPAVGGGRPAHCTALGKILLARMERESGLMSIWARRPLVGSDALRSITVIPSCSGATEFAAGSNTSGIALRRWRIQCGGPLAWLVQVKGFHGEVRLSRSASRCRLSGAYLCKALEEKIRQSPCGQPAERMSGQVRLRRVCAEERGLQRASGKRPRKTAAAR